MEAAPFARTTLRMCSGAIIWSVHFGVIYGFTAVACARGFADAKWLGIEVVAWVIAAATALGVGAALGFVVPAMRRGLSAFEDWITASVGGLAAVAMVWEGLFPLALVQTCG